ncbi:diguanylate cyclase [Fulvimarina endophytica]|uniref:Diguanylate cyclase n=1 Tax=Fulvimarina endophytica TaxID=2293836 RepID=A0A371X275_9HYPH|nr:sensor domain-containing diguanylate cyclase [Fulvimarina endophytica]RFC63309.1 diguanylate cyclase [Fulvimarina endophytica]
MWNRPEDDIPQGHPPFADDEVFVNAPVPLWIEDWSGVKRLLDDLRAQGVTGLAAHLANDRDTVRRSAAAIRILAVNERTLALLKARSVEELRDNLGTVFSGDMYENHRLELCQLYERGSGFTSLAVNYTLKGEPLHMQVKGRIMPGYEDDWSCVLVSTEDVSAREESMRRLAASETFSRALFEHSPISLWVEDLSKIKDMLAEVRAMGVSDFRTFVDVHPEFVERCMREIRVVDVNQHTLTLYGAQTKAELFSRLGEVFRPETAPYFKEMIIKLWDGQSFHVREVVNYGLDGQVIHLHMQLSIFPGHEHDWSLAQIALTDITARKKAEAYLEYLGKHDVLTKLNNRSFFDDELKRLERCGAYPVTVLAADLNGLKHVNDTLGHAAGDGVLRRAGEVLREAVSDPMRAARIGGDEFVVLMPGSGEEDGQALMDEIGKLTAINNRFYPGAELSFSIGLATGLAGERLEEVVNRADEGMYRAKRDYYETIVAGGRKSDRKSLSDIVKAIKLRRIAEDD